MIFTLNTGLRSVVYVPIYCKLDVFIDSTKLQFDTSFNYLDFH